MKKWPYKRGCLSWEGGELVFYCSNVSEIWPHKRGVFGKSGFIRGNFKNQYSPTLWYRKFYDIVYSCAISTNFRCHFFKLTTTVPLDTDIPFFLSNCSSKFPIDHMLIVLLFSNRVLKEALAGNDIFEA